MFYERLSKSELITLLREKISASNPNKLADFFRESIKDWSVENFHYLLCDCNLNIIRTIKRQGSVNSCVVWAAQDWKKILNTKKVCRVAAVHNHPAGSLVFSAEDLKTKEKIKKIAELFSIELFDFLIVTETGYLSAAETGNL